VIEENKRTVIKLIQLVWNQGNHALVRPLLDVGFVYQGSLSEAPMDAQEFLDHARSIRESVADFHVAIEEIVAENDSVVTFSSLAGQLVKPVFGLPPSDRVVSLPVVSIYHLRHGRVRDLTTLYDVQAIKRQLGVS